MHLSSHSDTLDGITMGRKLNLIVAAALVVTAAGPVHAQDDWVGLITRSTGTVLIERDGERLAAPAGTEVRRGDRLMTGANGQVNVRMKGSAPLNVGPRASVALDRYVVEEPLVAETPARPVLQGLASFFALNRHR
jgi:hypothetical protein